MIVAMDGCVGHWRLPFVVTYVAAREDSAPTDEFVFSRQAGAEQRQSLICNTFRCKICEQLRRFV
jgi:hypothetical protein